jgi:hypothetical protein
MRIAALLTFLLAGCATAPTTAPTDASDAVALEADVTLLAKAERVNDSWENVTWSASCAIPLPAGACLGENHVYNERRLKGIGWDLWLNFTWEANDEANRELTVSYGANETTGPSPLVIHVQRPEQDIVVSVNGTITPFLLGYTEAPPQQFAATASFIPRTVQR